MHSGFPLMIKVFWSGEGPSPSRSISTRAPESVQMRLMVSPPRPIRNPTDSTGTPIFTDSWPSSNGVRLLRVASSSMSLKIKSFAFSTSSTDPEIVIVRKFVPGSHIFFDLHPCIGVLLNVADGLPSGANDESNHILFHSQRVARSSTDDPSPCFLLLNQFRNLFHGIHDLLLGSCNSHFPGNSTRFTLLFNVDFRTRGLFDLLNSFTARTNDKPDLILCDV
mmetsp:Transcript_71028/g.162870  ORF Transcript_71028/g.162870 Transcript_71028/m.162870 type:complete len:222 (-) Transcript_71028:1029-1694(-)